MILNQTFFVLSDSESIFFQRVGIRIEYFKTFQILNVHLMQMFAKYSCVHQNRARFGNILM